MDMILVLILVLLILIIIFLLYKIKRYQNKIASIIDLGQNEKFNLAEASLNILEKAEKLEEQKKILQEQKFKLAEANLNILELKEQVEIEKDKSEKLLLNILPRKIADELKTHGKADPETFENVTVYFSDIVGFTNQSSKLNPAKLIDELNIIFTEFDNIMNRHQCERIKTIGDAYLSVCGMPIPNEKHAENMINASKEIIQYLNNKNQTSEIQWKIRIGINSGSVVGGIVGIKKYIYDIFGDTINLASRMETNSEPMRINVSENTYQIVKDKFQFETRGLLEAKGKGLVNMYFVVE